MRLIVQAECGGFGVLPIKSFIGRIACDDIVVLN
jgi:hypothetical protein